MTVDDAVAARRISVVVVTYNSSKVIGAALASIPRPAEIIVVDNASADRSAEIARAASCGVVENPANLGFGTACNQGAQHSTRELILFLNPDARLDQGALAAMVRALDADPNAAAVGPRLIAPDGSVTLRLSSLLHPWDRRKSHRPPLPEGECCVPLLSGAALLVRAFWFAEIGGFDEDLFLYHEDDDLCLRLTRSGRSLLYAPDATVHHLQGGSSGGTFELNRFKSYHGFLARVHVARKHGVPFSFASEARRCATRLLIAALTCDRRRLPLAVGRAQAYWRVLLHTGR